MIVRTLVWLGWRKPTIVWEEGGPLEEFDDEPMYWAEVIGYDELGREWGGVGEYCGSRTTSSELWEVTEIQLVRSRCYAGTRSC